MTELSLQQLLIDRKEILSAPLELPNHKGRMMDCNGSVLDDVYINILNEN